MLCFWACTPGEIADNASKQFVYDWQEQLYGKDIKAAAAQLHTMDKDNGTTAGDEQLQDKSQVLDSDEELDKAMSMPTLPAGRGGQKRLSLLNRALKKRPAAVPYQN